MWSFTFKGESSRDYGITVNRRAPRQSANMRTVITEVDGTDGAYIDKVGYNTYTMSISMTIQGKENLLRISSWLKGQGEFTRSDIPNRGLLVEHQSELTYTMIVEDLYSCDTTFQVIRPHWYLIEDTWSRPWGTNLIPNGWESFTPYGSGENFATNWDFSDDNLTTWASSYGNHYIENGVYVKKITEEHSAARIETWNRLGSGEYVWVIKIRGNSRVAFRNHGNAEAQEVIIDLEDREYTVVKIPFSVNVTDKETVTLRGYIRSTPVVGSQVEIDWNYISKIDNQHLVVEKTPLENGLTRIQTWGGNHGNKITLSSILTDTDKVYTYTNYVSDNVDTGEVSITGFGSVLMGVDNFLNISVKGMGNRGILARIRAKNVSDNLDFLASDPQIVEGDKPSTWQADSNPRIVNEGNATAFPIIRLVKGKEETVDVVVDGVRFVYNFKENDTYVDIDCFTQEAYSEKRKTNRQLKIGYKYPELKPGDNVVQINSGDPTILFRRKDAWR